MSNQCTSPIPRCTCGCISIFHSVVEHYSHSYKSFLFADLNLNLTHPILNTIVHLKIADESPYSLTTYSNMLHPYCIQLIKDSVICLHKGQIVVCLITTSLLHSHSIYYCQALIAPIKQKLAMYARLKIFL